MLEALKWSDGILTAVFFVVFYILFYLSVKRCFLKDNKSKVKLVFLTLLTNPIVSIFACQFPALVVVGFYEGFVGTVEEFTIDASLQMVIAITTTIFYIPLVLLSAWLVGKWLGIKKKAPLVYLYVMYNTFFVFQIRGMSEQPGIDALWLYGLDNASNLISLIMVLFFYRLAVRELASLPMEDMDINWNAFIIPPLVYLALYAMFSIGISISTDVVLVLSTGVFSIAIGCLFIWAFYVIIKNLKATNVIKILSVEVMEALAHTIDAKDEYTNGHSVRVAKYSKMLAEKLGLSAKESESLYYMALLHDIGKIGVPNSIINSKSKLTEEQYAVIKKHPGLGYDILSEIKSRPDLSFGARWHHERYDGTGYPDKKTGEDIPLAARIIAVADSYDAMTSNRSYRGFLSQDAVRMEIEKNSGTQFDRNVARCMLEIIDEDKDYVLHE